MTVYPSFIHSYIHIYIYMCYCNIIHPSRKQILARRRPQTSLISLPADQERACPNPIHSHHLAFPCPFTASPDAQPATYISMAKRSRSSSPPTGSQTLPTLVHPLHHTPNAHFAHKDASPRPSIASSDWVIVLSLSFISPRSLSSVNVNA